jgi:hypothetical protein
MKSLLVIGSTVLGCVLFVGCEKSDKKTPSGAAANNSQATEKSASEMKKKAEDAGDAAKSAVSDSAKQAKSQADAAADALKKEAKPAADAANTSTAAADAEAKLKTVMDAIKDKKWDIADTTLKALEANKASLPATVSSQIDNARKLVDAGKSGLGSSTPAVPALPK